MLGPRQGFVGPEAQRSAIPRADRPPCGRHQWGGWGAGQQPSEAPHLTSKLLGEQCMQISLSHSVTTVLLCLCPARDTLAV